jgi:2-polyprenyl-3-methyl-5-hydroxy-6-metoxy-1,4-benzoquinol methylase
MSGFSRDVIAYVRASLGEAPLRVLEVGAGEGELAAHLREAGHDVLAIDPGDGAGEGVRRVALLDLDEPERSFDAAVAIVSLHHVEPLQESFAHLAALLKPGAPVVVDEIDVDALDERAARWWLAQQAALGTDHQHEHTPAGLVEQMRHHIHSLATVREALAAHFDVGEPVRGPYLHRWYLPHSLRDAEIELIAAGKLPAMGARFVARRR